MEGQLESVADNENWGGSSQLPCAIESFNLKIPTRDLLFEVGKSPLPLTVNLPFLDPIDTPACRVALLPTAQHLP